MVEQFGYSSFLTIGEKVKGIWVTEPLGYLEFLHLNMHARMVLTDSGGLQEETAVLGVSCII
jgi:UDP-N-acetylglucosamine 2-epimerase (non-hydrolysing)